MVQLKNKIIPICLQRTRIWSIKRQSENTYIYKHIYIKQNQRGQKREDHTLFSKFFRLWRSFQKNVHILQAIDVQFLYKATALN